MLKNKIFCTLLMFFLLAVLSNCKNNQKPYTPPGSPIAKDSTLTNKPSSRSGKIGEAVSQESVSQAASPEGIEGTYVVINKYENAEKCMMKITIEKTSDQYRYTFQSESRTLKGKLSLEADKSGNGYFITLEGIEWSEYEGALDDEGEPKEKDLALPVGIQGAIQENAITIQNYGNSMNYYQQLADCGDKYIVLQKQ
ncbi:hypothetical protein [Pedobacter sp. R20-19]|uniref:hypothetical protein n=1 Tax=Pedobacter sp. R20-19 TaxID=1270196 RepID=UPI00068C690A|nr:hypothetical protein [Pedobacter sp. R20-19]